MGAADGSLLEMPHFPRFIARRSVDAVTAEALLAGRGVPADAPAAQQALELLLEVAAGPGSEQELAGEVAAAAAFVQVTSKVRSRSITRRVLAAAACVIAVGGAVAYVGTASAPLPHRTPPSLHSTAPVPFGVPVAPHEVPAPHVTGGPSPQARRQRINPHGPASHQIHHIHPATSPGVPLRAGARS
jgi:hypothetical protein